MTKEKYKQLLEMIIFLYNSIDNYIIYELKINQESKSFRQYKSDIKIGKFKFSKERIEIITMKYFLKKNNDVFKDVPNSFSGFYSF